LTAGKRSRFYFQEFRGSARAISFGPILLPHLMRAILTKRLTFRGFIVSDFFGRYGDFMRDVSTWVGEGRIKYREDVVEGLENAPRALIGLLRRGEFGKLLVRVAPALHNPDD
jgi:NADPH-dependent curcumin reductase